MRHGHRGTFSSMYAIPKESEHRKAGPRMGDYMLVMSQPGDSRYFAAVHDAGFIVVDTQTHEKAWFEVPYGYGPQQITAMIESHFSAPAVLIANRFWIV